jgi:hypothetical protein
MAIPAISPIVIPPVFSESIRQTRELGSPPNPFEVALTNTANGMANTPAVLQPPSSRTQAVSSLEQALFNQWVGSLQSVSSGSLGAALDNVLAGLGVTGTAEASSQLPFDPNNPQSLLLAARLISLFSTIDLLGGEAGGGPQLGTLLDTLA